MEVSAKRNSKTSVQERFSSRLNEAIASLHPVPTQRDVAKRFGVTYSAVNLWMKGKTVPSPELIDEIAIWLGVSIDWLFGVDAERGEPKHSPLTIVEYNYVVQQLQTKRFTVAEIETLMSLVK